MQHLAMMFINQRVGKKHTQKKCEETELNAPKNTLISGKSTVLCFVFTFSTKFHVNLIANG